MSIKIAVTETTTRAATVAFTNCDWQVDSEAPFDERYMWIRGTATKDAKVALPCMLSAEPTTAWIATRHASFISGGVKDPLTAFEYTIYASNASDPIVTMVVQPTRNHLEIADYHYDIHSDVAFVRWFGALDIEFGSKGYGRWQALLDDLADLTYGMVPVIAADAQAALDEGTVE